jgi:glycosyltransferase involved in cell wall biosynthesis
VEAELMRIPFSWSPSERLIDEILLNRRLRLWNVDRVIGLKFPAYLIPHPQKVLWVLHQFRQAYDLGDAGQGLAADGREGQIRAAIREADNACFAEAHARFVNSPVTRDRMRRYNGFEAEVLYPPLNDEALFQPAEVGDYIFAGGRVAEGKRQHLLVEAMAATGGTGRLVIAGPSEDPAYAERLRRRVAELALEDRVVLKFGFHPRAEIAAWVRGARACAYLPFDEDSLGYVTMEAFACGKAVITTTDSGGLLEMVDDSTGLVVPPDAASLASALAMLLEYPAVARAKGRAAAAEWRRRDLTWSATVDRLLS